MSRTTLAAVLATAPALAFAQLGALEHARGAAATSDAGNARIERAADAQLENPAPAERREGGSAPVPGEPDGVLDLAAPAEGGASAAGGATVPPPDTYTIRPGDTLWDLSGRFLNNPWYWPKIWSYNPEITNPHWISPGNVLKFYPSAEEAPGRVEPLAPDDPVAAAPQPEALDEEDGPPVRELEDFSRADMKAPASVEEQDSVAVAGPHKVGYVPTKQLFARHDTFVTPQQLEASGAIEAAFEEKLMLSTTDSAYARFQEAAGVKVGETYVVYRTERPIVHPETRELIGYQSTVLGSARVTAVDEKAATLVITSANDAIERGAMLGPWTEKVFRPVKHRPNAKDLDGRIVAAPVSVLTQFAEHQVVFVDRGSADGVEAGNVLKVVRSGDLYGKDPARPVWDDSLPKEDVGDLLVIDARERTSAALVTKSLAELVVGDRFEMRAAAGAAPAKADEDEETPGAGSAR